MPPPGSPTVATVHLVNFSENRSSLAGVLVLLVSDLFQATGLRGMHVDGIVYVTGKGLATGKIAPCEIVASKEYDLVGALSGKPR